MGWKYLIILHVKTVVIEQYHQLYIFFFETFVIMHMLCLAVAYYFRACI